jgi:hypothetical protein
MPIWAPYPSKQQPLNPNRGASEHDFAVNRFEWENAIFDDADHFNAICYRERPFRVTEFATFAEARDYASRIPCCCVYAISPGGRSCLLDREVWNLWLRRETLTR